MIELIVRPLAEADVRYAAFWFESKREGLGAEFAFEVDAVYERIVQNPRQLPEIDEDISVEGMLHGTPARQPKPRAPATGP